MTPSLRHLVEDHLKPKWWQFWRKQKYHVCIKYGSAAIYEIPDMCPASRDLHHARTCAIISYQGVEPNCGDGCPILKASDPFFFTKLDEYLARQCYSEENNTKISVMSSSPKMGPIGPMGPSGPQGPPGPPGGGTI